MVPYIIMADISVAVCDGFIEKLDNAKTYVWNSGHALTEEHDKAH